MSIVQEINNTTADNGMKTILFCATHPCMTAGYARIANILTNYLAASKKFKVVYFAFSYIPSIAVQRSVHPDSQIIDTVKEEAEIVKELKYENFGSSIITKTIAEVKPDIVMIYNDILVLSTLLSAIAEWKKNTVVSATEFPEVDKMKVVSYIDLVYKYESSVHMSFVDQHSDYIFTFTEGWKDHLMNDYKIAGSKIKVRPHGFHDDIFKAIDNKEAKSKFGWDPESFVVLNTNKNTCRKQLDITVEAFMIFCLMVAQEFGTEDVEKIRLVFNCDIAPPSGHNLIEAIKMNCIKYKIPEELMLFKHIISLSTSGNLLTDEMCNNMMNASDMGLHTCCGEGFGLCNLEGAALGIPQVVTNVGGLSTIFKQFPECLVEPCATVRCSPVFEHHLGDMYLVKAQDVAQKMFTFYKDLKNKPEQMTTFKQALKVNVKMNYNWNKILPKFVKDLTSITKPVEIATFNMAPLIPASAASTSATSN